MYYKILIISILLFVGCDTKKVAIGEANMITIFCSEEDLFNRCSMNISLNPLIFHNLKDSMNFNGKIP